jgi:hypothetical protein
LLAGLDTVAERGQVVSLFGLRQGMCLVEVRPVPVSVSCAFEIELATTPDMPVLGRASVPDGGEVTMTRAKNDAERDRTALILHLRELIEALERRMPHIEREGETRIARDAAALKAAALERLAELEK